MRDERLTLRVPRPFLTRRRLAAAWLDAEGGRLLRFGTAAAPAAGAGFAWLDASGTPDPAPGVQLWITARMAHVRLARLRGRPGASPLADRGLAALDGPLRDAKHGGWYPAIPEPGKRRRTAARRRTDTLSSSSPRQVLTVAGRAGAKALLADACDVMESRFWDDRRGWVRESWDRAWQEPEAYLGANANMHAVEAFLAAADATGDGVWRDRALRIAEFFVDHVARSQWWRIPEHFSADGHIVPEYHDTNRADLFRPYGTTPGHALEWARLLLNLEAALPDPPNWLAEAARWLFVVAVGAGWDTDGQPGFVYTVDHDDRPAVPRPHALGDRERSAPPRPCTGGPATWSTSNWYRTWWDYCAQYVIDERDGSWHHELDADNQPASTVSGRQAGHLPRLPGHPPPQLPLAGSAAARRTRRCLRR
ncbi:AGE family epimerase/isomerase [Yinghuangia aomiensis]